MRAMFFAVTSKGSVQRTIARLPNCSKLMPSCKLHVEQEPQSPNPVMRKSICSAAWASVSAGVGALALDLE